MTSVTLDDGTRTDVLTRVGPVLLAVHGGLCNRPLLKINPDRKEWFCFACRTHGTVESIHVEQETPGELGEAR